MREKPAPKAEPGSIFGHGRTGPRKRSQARLSEALLLRRYADVFDHLRILRPLGARELAELLAGRDVQLEALIHDALARLRLRERRREL